MNRLGPVLLVLALLGGTAAAFAYTDSLKATKSPVVSTHVTKLFSPTCTCSATQAYVIFSLRRADHATVSIVDSSGRIVRTLVDNEARPAGRNRFIWDGRRDDGSTAPDGVYEPRVELEDADRTLRLPNSIRLDTTPPVIRVVGPPSLKDGTLTIRYRVNEPARAALYVGSRRVLLTFRRPLTDALEIAPASLGIQGIKPLRIAAEDLAGNISKPHPL